MGERAKKTNNWISTSIELIKRLFFDIQLFELNQKVFNYKVAGGQV